MTFDLSQLTRPQRLIIDGAIARCDFPFELCLPALHDRWGRRSIVVTWEPLEPYLGGVGHEHDESVHATAHPVQARGRVAGLAWTDGRIMLAPWLESESALAVEVWLAEAAHQVDFFFISQDQRRALFALFHHGDPTPHDDHGWFEEAGNQNYWDWVGESWMAAFTLAYSDVVPDWMDFSHRVTAEARDTIRSILGVPMPPAPPSGPAPYFGATRSKLFHDQHRRVTRDLEWATRELAIASGRRPCGTCRP